jgi:hypothetical protein
MAFSLPPALDQWVQQKLATGRYDSAEAVLLAACDALDEHEQTVAGIQEGNDDYLAGRYKTLGDADATFRRQHNIPPKA